MKKKKYTGWQKIFSFAFLQTMKGKGMLVSIIIMCLFAAAILPIMDYTKGDSIAGKDPNGGIELPGDEEMLEADNIYLLNETGLSSFNLEELVKETELFAGEYIHETRSLEELKKELDQNQQDKSLIMHVTYEPMMAFFQFHYATSDKTALEEESVEQFAGAIANTWYDYLMKKENISEEQIILLNEDVEIQYGYYTVDENGKGSVESKEKKLLSEAGYFVLYANLMIVIMLCSMVSEYIAGSIIGDKSSKVIEFLLITVQPAALMLGKIAAMLAVVGVTMGAMLASFGASVLFIMGTNPDSPSLKGFSEQIEILTESGFQINMMTILITILVILAGVLLYSSIAGLMSSLVSRIEEVAEASKTLVLVLIVSAYLAIALVSVDQFSGFSYDIWHVLAMFVPLTSPFLIPGYLILGYISLPVAIGALAVLIVFTILLLNFAAKAFHMTIYHNGNPIKFKELMHMMKLTKKKKEKTNE